MPDGNGTRNPLIEAAANALARAWWDVRNVPDQWLALAHRLNAAGLLAHPVDRTSSVRADVAAIVEKILANDTAAAAENASDRTRIDALRDALRELLGMVGPIGDPRELHECAELARHALAVDRARTAQETPRR